MATEHKAFDKARMSRFWGKVKTYVASAISGLYTKPSGGIPKTDLADSVQTSLGKADSALQSFTESDPTVPAWAKQPSKPTYTAQEVGALPASTPIPTKTSDLTNDSGFLTQHQDISGKQDVIDDLQTIRSGASVGSTALQPSDIADWAKQSSKPTYTASEVGALADTTKYASSKSVAGAADKAVSIPFGQVDSTSTNTAFTATIDGITELRDGVAVWLKNGVVKSSTSRWTLNINGLGAKNVVKSMQMSSSAGNTFDTNYAMLFVFDATQDVWMMNFGYYADMNDTAYKLRAINGGRTAFNTIKANILLLSKDSKYVIAVNESGSTGTNKTLTTESFDPFGQIWNYTNGTIDIAPEGNVPNGYLWCQVGQHDARRSFNISTTEFEEKKDVYLVAVPQSDGSAKLHSSPITQTLPSTEDGLIYIYLGIANAAYQFDLYLKHPIYYFKDGAIRQWTNQDTTALKLGTSTVGGTTQGIYLNQGVPAACESYDMWYMKHIAALYGATRNDATGLWSYYYTKCARWDDTQEKIVWDRNIGYDDITDEEMMDMCDHRLHSLQGVYGCARAMRSRIALHFIGYSNNKGAAQPCAYTGNKYVVTYGYVGQKGGAYGNSFFPWHLQDTFLVSKVKHVIGRSGPSDATVTAPAGSLLEYATVTFNANNQTLNFGTCPNIEFVSIMYTLTDDGGVNRTGCTLVLHPDVYAKIFDSTNADYALWHKIDLANQARTNPITIQSA